MLSHIRQVAPGNAKSYKKPSVDAAIRAAKNEIKLLNGWSQLGKDNLEGSVKLLLTTLCSIAIANTSIDADGFVGIMKSPMDAPPKRAKDAVSMAKKIIRTDDREELGYQLAKAAQIIKAFIDGKDW